MRGLLESLAKGFRRAAFAAALTQVVLAAVGEVTAAAPDAPSKLPVLTLTVKGAITSDQKTPCTLTVPEAGPTAPGGSNSWPGVVRFHGATSQGYPKKSFGVTLSAPARLLDLRESAHWVLNAAFIDRSLMRHKLSYDLFRSLSTSNAPRRAVASRFVEVRLNGEEQGVYLLMERMDRALLELRPFRSNDASHASIYKAVDHAANFGHAGRAGYEQREPDPLTLPWWGPLEEFNRFVSRSPEPQLFDPTNGIAARLDVDNAIDFHLLVLLTSNLDGITKNFIFARDAQDTARPAAKFFFAPWDYDGTFGRNWNATPVSPSEWLSNRLFDRLMGNRDYREKFAARWRRLREREFSVATVQGLIDASVRTLGEAARRNAARWRQAEGYYPDQLTFDEDVSQMKAWVEARVRWLDGEITRRSAER